MDVWSETLLARAEAGDVDAQVAIGRAYWLGLGVRRDKAAARHWFERAAEMGHGAAAWELARAHKFGQGAPKDAAAARRWFIAGAEAGHALSAWHAGAIFQFGLGGAPKDLEAAARFYRMAADRGIGIARSNLFLTQAERVSPGFMRTMVGGLVAVELLLIIFLLAHANECRVSPLDPFLAFGVLTIGTVMGAKLWQVRRVLPAGRSK